MNGCEGCGPLRSRLRRTRAKLAEIRALASKKEIVIRQPDRSYVMHRTAREGSPTKEQVSVASNQKRVLDGDIDNSSRAI